MIIGKKDSKQNLIQNLDYCVAICMYYSLTISFSNVKYVFVNKHLKRVQNYFCILSRLCQIIKKV